MARNKAVSIPASRGMDATSDAAALPADMAQQIVNLLPDRSGLLRSNVSLTTVLPAALPFAIDGGISWFYSQDGKSDRLLFVAGGWLWAAQPTTVPPTYPPTFFAAQAVPYGGPLGNPPFAIGKQVRTAAYQQETIFVQDGGIQPLRYDGTGLFQLGISTPPAPIVTLLGAGNVNGTENYTYTLFDSKFRQSSPAPYTQIVAGSNIVQIQVNYGTDPQVVGAYIYRTVSGAVTLLRVATLTKPNMVATDNAADNDIAKNVPGPAFGENDIPSPASCVAILKNYVFMNNTNNPQQLQVSNLNAPTQWASVSIVPTPATDGAKYIAATDQGDQVNALLPFGSLLGIVKRRNIYLLWGDNVSNFIVRAIHERGSSAPNSMVRCDNVLCGFLDDDVAVLDYQSAFLIGKISKPIEALLQGYATGQWNSVEGAWAAYVNDKYLLGIGNTVFSYDFDSKGWSELAYTLEQGYVVTQRNAPPLLYAATPQGQVAALDMYRQATVSGAIWRTRAFSFGEQEGKPPRTARGVVVRIRVFGEGVIEAGTMILTLDNTRTISTPFFAPPTDNSDVLWYCEYDSDAWGYLADVALTGLSGTNLNIRSLEVEFYGLN